MHIRLVPEAANKQHCVCLARFDDKWITGCLNARAHSAVDPRTQLRCELEEKACVVLAADLNPRELRQHVELIPESSQIFERVMEALIHRQLAAKQAADRLKVH